MEANCDIDQFHTKPSKRFDDLFHKILSYRMHYFKQSLSLSKRFADVELSIKLGVSI